MTATEFIILVPLLIGVFAYMWVIYKDDDGGYM